MRSDCVLQSLQLAALTQTGRAVHPVVEGVHEEDLHVGDVPVGVAETSSGVAAVLPGDIAGEQLVALTGALYPSEPTGTGWKDRR